MGRKKNWKHSFYGKKEGFFSILSLKVLGYGYLKALFLSQNMVSNLVH